MDLMVSIIPGYEYDIFISYRQKDNKCDRWVSEFVEALKTELESTFKEEISVYFDVNPHDGLLETHDVDASLKDKLKCLVFIPIISRTYCDPKSFAWEHEFKAFVDQASQDQFGLKVKLPNGNVSSRVLPVRIHDLDNDDMKLCESVLDGVLRGVDFIYKEPGVDRPLTSDDDEKINLNKTKYRNQVNKVALAIKEIITAIKKHSQQEGEVSKEVLNIKPKPIRNLKPTVIIASVVILALILLGYFYIPKLFKPSKVIEKSIAVLPFINDSPSDSNKYFINGVMEDILCDLQTIKELRPISRTSTEKYRTTTKSIPEIAKELSVNYIVEGSGQKSGNTIRLNVKLFRAYNEGPLWGNTYEQEMHDARDIFRIQSQIAEAIATELKTVITPNEKRLIEKTPTTNLAAYEAYLQGIFYWRKFTQLDEEVALQYFEQAIEKDPKYALAYAGICNVWQLRSNASFASPSEAIPKETAALTKALELDSTWAEVYHSLAFYKTYIMWDLKGGESAIKKAIAINPNFADAYLLYEEILIITGRIKEAMEQVEIALKLDPLNILCKTEYGLTLYFSRRYEDAITTFHGVLKIDPANQLALETLPGAFHQIGKQKEEMEAWKSFYSIIFKDFTNVFDEGYAKGGYIGALNLEADTLVAQSKTKNINPWEIALIYSCAGNKERAMDMLDHGYKAHDPNMVFMLYPVFDILRNEQRFKELAHKLKVPYK
jgi:TolB-like protein/Tfp pilus assembly protein PilF